MVAIAEPRVEIDDRIRENPALLEAITRAMAYLGRQESRVPLPAAIRWRHLPLDPYSIELTMSDSLGFSDMVSRRVFSLADMGDEYTREVGVLRTYGDLLHLRSGKHLTKIDDMIRAIDFTIYTKDLNRALEEQIEPQL